MADDKLDSLMQKLVDILPEEVRAEFLAEWDKIGPDTDTEVNAAATERIAELLPEDMRRGFWQGLKLVIVDLAGKKPQ